MIERLKKIYKKININAKLLSNNVRGPFGPLFKIIYIKSLIKSKPHV